MFCMKNEKKNNMNINEYQRIANEAAMAKKSDNSN